MSISAFKNLLVTCAWPRHSTSSSLIHQHVPLSPWRQSRTRHCHLGGSQNHPEACCVALMKMHFTILFVNTGLRLVFSFPVETRPGKGPQTRPLMSKPMRSANSWQWHWPVVTEEMVTGWMIGRRVTYCNTAPIIFNQLRAPWVWEVVPLGPLGKSPDFSTLVNDSWCALASWSVKDDLEQVGLVCG